MNFLLHQFIDSTAERSPRREAIRCLSQNLSYQELARKSNCLANALVAQGVSRQDRVGIYMDKSLEMAIAMYGIMKAGAAYVPLDPRAPTERLAYVLQDCGIRHLVTDRGKEKRLRPLADSQVGLECLVGIEADADLPFRSSSWDEVFEAPDHAPPKVKIIENDLAYIIYTSGSTGDPKGIMHTHHSGLSFARWAASEYGLRSDDRLSNHAPLHFDLSIFDFFAGAVAGAATVIIPEDYAKLPASYSKLVADQQITVLFTVPFALIQLLLRGLLDERDFTALRWVIFGGEPFPGKHLRALMARLSHVRFDNMYGPAETNGCTHYTVPASFDFNKPIPIGPISAVADALVVDDTDEPVSPGEAGELLVRSPTMMQGYWGRPDLNQRAFFRLAFGEHQQVFYRTGDLVREVGDGFYQFLGRKDRQVKVRGYRVELDEVELALASNEHVEEAAVFSVPDTEGSQQIRGAVILKRGADTTTDELLSKLEARLPMYALPNTLALREGFPRTSTGKIDRRALRAEAMNTPGRQPGGV